MPIYGEAKTRNMIRSVLPSTARKGAREDLRLARKRGRTGMRSNLRKYRGSAALAEEIYADDNTNFEFYPYEDIKYAMWDRRSADKLGPLQRWAAVKVRDIRPEDRRSWMLARLPNSTIGRHAMSHVEDLPEFPEQNPYLYGRFSFYRQQRSWAPEDTAWYDAARYAAIEDRLRRLLDIKGAHKRLNRSAAAITYEFFMVEPDYAPKLNEEKFYRWWGHLNGQRVERGWWVKAEVRRPLEGYHDIPRFVGMYRQHEYGSKSALERILDELGY